jgi:hypothetical protein
MPVPDSFDSGPGVPSAPAHVPAGSPGPPAAEPAAVGPAPSPVQPPPLRGRDVLLGIALLWPVELLGQAVLGLAGALLVRAGLPNPPGWRVHPFMAVPYGFASAAWTCAVV